MHETLFLVGLHVTRGCGGGKSCLGEGWCSFTVVDVTAVPTKGRGDPSVLRLLGRLGHSLGGGRVMSSGLDCRGHPHHLWGYSKQTLSSQGAAQVPGGREDKRGGCPGHQRSQSWSRPGTL